MAIWKNVICAALGLCTPAASHVHCNSETEGILRCWGVACEYPVSLMRCLGDNLLACARFALRPVGCGSSLFAALFMPNRTAGGGPVFCGTSGAMVGC